MSIETQILPVDGGLPKVSFQWNFKTEILVGAMDAPDAESADMRTIQLGGSHGSYVSLNLLGDVLVGVEIVVWPHCDTVRDMNLPPISNEGRLRVLPDDSISNSGVMELPAPLSCTRTEDQGKMHVVLGQPGKVEVVALAENLLVDVDEVGRLAGIWLAGVPPFPEVKESE